MKDNGGRPGTGYIPPDVTPPIGPLVPTFSPMPTVPPVGNTNTYLPQTTLKKYDILHELGDISDRRHRPRSVQVVGLPGKATSVAGQDARLVIAFRKYLHYEETEFMTLILSTLEDDCCEC